MAASLRRRELGSRGTSAFGRRHQAAQWRPWLGTLFCVWCVFKSPINPITSSNLVYSHALSRTHTDTCALEMNTVVAYWPHLNWFFDISRTIPQYYFILKNFVWAFVAVKHPCIGSTFPSSLSWSNRNVEEGENGVNQFAEIKGRIAVLKHSDVLLSWNVTDVTDLTVIIYKLCFSHFWDKNSYFCLCRRRNARNVAENSVSVVILCLKI
jgi:hypothetical protein